MTVASTGVCDAAAYLHGDCLLYSQTDLFLDAADNRAAQFFKTVIASCPSTNRLLMCIRGKSGKNIGMANQLNEAKAFSSVYKSFGKC